MKVLYSPKFPRVLRKPGVKTFRLVVMYLTHKNEGSIFTFSLCRDGTSHMSYKLLNDVEGQSVVTLRSQGEVLSSVINGHAVVMVTALEEELGLNQTVVVHVEVCGPVRI